MIRTVKLKKGTRIYSARNDADRYTSPDYQSFTELEENLQLEVARYGELKDYAAVKVELTAGASFGWVRVSDIETI